MGFLLGVLFQIKALNAGQTRKKTHSNIGAEKFFLSIAQKPSVEGWSRNNDKFGHIKKTTSIQVKITAK